MITTTTGLGRHTGWTVRLKSSSQAPLVSSTMPEPPPHQPTLAVFHSNAHLLWSPFILFSMFIISIYLQMVTKRKGSILSPVLIPHPSMNVTLCSEKVMNETTALPKLEGLYCGCGEVCSTPGRGARRALNAGGNDLHLFKAQICQSSGSSKNDSALEGRLLHYPKRG